MRRVILGLTGASGAAYGVRALEMLAKLDDVESHLIVTTAGRLTIGLETDRSMVEVEGLADVVHPVRDISAGPASGSFRSAGMLVAPCSIRALSAIANSHSADLLVRAADVTLKERRPLVLMVREAPLHLGHLRLMSRVVEMGGIVFPPVPALYTCPDDLEEVVSHTAARALDLLGIDVDGMDRWTGLDGAAATD
ncbi:MAG TPA: 3-octaprenyl-4-hydroxybenzoate carboxy-lyase [Acidimicrobiaceae bacterium]|nr:3-octaprenyl-4-hydroxybenzoate carboxy-lyase [Acidimicrobiaceae bacterium]HCV36982.1 3-octaprenyl-4-hydroxybenzoate carboxy-lyase [Acidimicrobiaceae bacterium]